MSEDSVSEQNEVDFPMKSNNFEIQHNQDINENRNEEDQFPEEYYDRNEDEDGDNEDNTIQVLRRCETPPSASAPDPVGIENCKQLFSPLLAFTTQKTATHSTDIISAVYVAFFGS